MLATLLSLSILVASATTAFSFSWAVPSKYHHFTKRLAPNIYTGQTAQIFMTTAHSLHHLIKLLYVGGEGTVSVD